MSKITSVSDTARWVAVYRAMETARPDALFRDPFAARLAGERGVAMVDHMKRGRQMAWAMITRTVAFDEIILARIRAGVDRVINLAAGLDTRPWRLDVPASLRWIDVDLPGMTQYKAEQMRGETPRCAYESIAADLANADERRALFARLHDPSRTTLVVAEGLLIYLAPNDVASLARDIGDVLGARWWLIDLASPDLLRIMKKYWGKAVEAGAAPFLFAPEESTGFFAPHGWHEIEYRGSAEESRRIDRQMPGAWMWRLLAKFQSAEKRKRWERFSGFALLERNAS